MSKIVEGVNINAYSCDNCGQGPRGCICTTMPVGGDMEDSKHGYLIDKRSSFKKALNAQHGPKRAEKIINKIEKHGRAPWPTPKKGR